MTVGNTFRELAAGIDALEAAGLRVVGIEPDGDLAGDEAAIRARVEVPILDGVEEPEAIEIEPSSTDIEGGKLAVDLTVRVAGDASERDTAGGEATDAEAPEDLETAEDADGDDSTPVHRDPERLRAVYAEHDTFEEMTEALGTEVTPQTVRRNMMKHGIHDPETGDGGESTDADDEEKPTDADEESAEIDEDAPGSETAITDGIDLPEGITLGDLKELVEDARTVHEVQRGLDTSRERTRRLLDELDLLDLLSGRLAEAESAPSREEIEERIRRASPDAA